MRRRICDMCGEPFEAARRDARFCSAKCRKRSWKGEPHVPHPGQLPGPIEREARALLARLDVDVEGDDVARAALRCAAAMDDPATPPGTLPGLSRALTDAVTHCREIARSRD